MEKILRCFDYGIAVLIGVALGLILPQCGSNDTAELAERYKEAEQRADAAEQRADELGRRAEDLNNRLNEYTERLSDSLRQSSSGLQDQSGTIESAIQILEQIQENLVDSDSSLDSTGERPNDRFGT